MTPIVARTSPLACAATANPTSGSRWKRTPYRIGIAHDQGSAAEPWLECEPAARLLVIWGRRPDRRVQVRSHMSPETLVRLHAILAGY